MERRRVLNLARYHPVPQMIRSRGRFFVTARAEVIWLLVVATLLGYQLLSPPLVGLADNGDFPKVMGRFAINYPSPSPDERYFNYFIAHYPIDPPHRWVSPFHTSENLLVWIAFQLNGFLSKDGLFHMAFLGSVHGLLFLAAAYLCVLWSRRLTPTTRWTLLVLFPFFFTDVAYVAYFNSFYTEPATLVFLLLALASALLLLELEPNRPVLLPVFFASAVLFTAAKSPNVPVGLLLAVFLARLSGANPARAWRFAAGFLAAVLAVFSLSVYWLTPAYYKADANYTAVFNEILGFSSSPADDLLELGLAPELVIYARTTPFTPGAAKLEQPEFRRAFVDRIDSGKILRFYLHHPARLFASLERSARQALLGRPMLGNFERSAGLPPGAQSQALRCWSRLMWRFGPHTAAGILCFLLANVLGAVPAWWLGDRERRLRAELAVALAVAALSQLVLVSIMQGSGDTARQMFLFEALFEILLLADVIFAVTGLSMLVRRAFPPGSSSGERLA